MASDLQDTVLQTRVDGGDLTALEVKYHLSYITELRNRHRSFLRQSQGSNSDGNEGKIGARAFVELITFIENCVENGTFCFKFSELRQIYESRLHDLGIRKEINKVRFKDRVLDYLKRSVECSDYQDDALTLMKAAKKVCNVLTRTRHAHKLSSMKHFFRMKVHMIKKQLNACKRVDVVWDTYVAWSQPGRNEAKEYD